jgi:Tol biopolymer transport system component
LFPILEILSGLLIVGLGATLLVQRVRAWMKSRAEPKLKILSTKDTKLHQGNVLGVTGQHTHAQGEVHPHDHAHDHGEHGHEHHIPDPSEINWRTLLALGVSGGLVPCPEAIAILLLAISISRILLGLSLILAFSFGLAFILIAIGVVMVQSKRLFARLGVLDRWAHAIPVVSATLVLLLGLALTFGAVRSAQAAVGQNASPAAGAPAFDFDRARVLFLASGADKRSQLFVAPAAGGEPRQLTDEPQGVRDFSVSLDGAWLAYSATEAGGGTNFWRLDPETFERSRLLACPTGLCSKLTWSRDPGRVLYSRLQLLGGDPGLGVPSIWWLDLVSGETGPAFQDAQIPALNFDWSPDGSWLSYASGLTLEIRINNLTTGAGYAIPTRTGAHLAWSPAGDAFLLADILDVGDDSYRKVFRYTAGDEQGALLIDDLEYDEYEPAWSPDGAWIALVRYRSGEAALAAGDQIWLVRPDGTELRALTDDADTLHGRPVWSPDGRYLLYTYSGISDPQPRLRILEIPTGAMYEVATGTQPAWLP